MKRAGLLAAAAIVLIANAFGLMHAWRNRSGPVETDITLTERELPLSHTSNDEDSEVALDLRWLDPALWRYGWESPARWLDQKTLRELGFDTTVAPSDDKASEFYQRQRARRAFVALEYDGPARRKYLDRVERQVMEHPGMSQSNVAANPAETETRLFVMDASTDAARLRARNPDRNSVIIVPAVVRIVVEPFLPANQNSRRGRHCCPAPSRKSRLQFTFPRPSAMLSSACPGIAIARSTGFTFVTALRLSPGSWA